MEFSVADSVRIFYHLFCIKLLFLFLSVCFQSVVNCLWHPKINQLFVGCGNGEIKVFFDPQKSRRYDNLCSKTEKKLDVSYVGFFATFRGAITCISKAKKKSESREMILPPRIITRKRLE